jgi:spore maturation protein SpmA
MARYFDGVLHGMAELRLGGSTGLMKSIGQWRPFLKLAHWANNREQESMLNNIWAFLIVSGLLMAGLLGRITGDGGVIEMALSDAKKAVMTIALPLAGVMMFWLGLLRLLEKAGVLNLLTRLLSPVLRLLFSQVPRDHPAMNAMVMNLGANMLGLGNAATPLGLKAMGHLQELNPSKRVPTNAMCVFLALNTAGFSLIPMSSITYLTAAGVNGPTRVIIPTILATAFTTLIAILACRTYEKFPFFAVRPSDLDAEAEGEVDAKVEHPITRGGWVALGALLFGFLGMAVLELGDPAWRIDLIRFLGLEGLLADAQAAQQHVAAKVSADPAPDVMNWKRIMNSASALAIPAILLVAIGVALARGVKVYEEFVEGAKEGFAVATRIMPFLVAMLAALAIFKGSGMLMILGHLLNPLLSFLGFPVDLLPLALMRPLSGSGSLGILNEILTNPELSEGVKMTAAIMFGSTETTFYVIAVYFGSVGIRNVRHALAAGLTADLAGMIAAVTFGRLLFGF